MPDPVEAMERFVARIAPYDPDPEHPVLTVQLRFGDSQGTFALSQRAARALYASNRSSRGGRAAKCGRNERRLGHGNDVPADLRTCGSTPAHLGLGPLAPVP